ADPGPTERRPAMRVLFTVEPSTGHLHPLVPVAQALTEAGHEVAVCSSASFRGEVEAFGLSHIGAGLDWITSDHSTWRAFPPMPPPGPEFAAFVVTVFADITARLMVPDLLAIAADWGSDLIVREAMEYGGCLAPEWVGRLPDRPTVLASLGTVFNTTPGVLEAIIDGLGREPMNLVVAIGPDQDPARFGTVPRNVRLEHYVPQPALLPLCDLFITHAGFNSVKESLISGVPMVAIPITADQPYCAGRCE